MTFSNVVAIFQILGITPYQAYALNPHREHRDIESRPRSVRRLEEGRL